MADHTLDLVYLRTISDGDVDFMRDLLVTYVKTTPEALVELQDTLKEEDWYKMGRVMHKIKPSYLLLDVKEVTELVLSLEQNAKHAKNLEQIPGQVDQLVESSEDIMAKVNIILEKDDLM